MLNNKTEKQMDKLYEKQEEEARRMGIDNVERRLFDNAIHEGSRYKQKSNKKNLFWSNKRGVLTYESKI